MMAPSSDIETRHGIDTTIRMLKNVNNLNIIDMLIVIGVFNRNFHIYSFFNSNVATLALYNALATAVNLKLKNASLPRLERHNALLRRFKTLVMQKDAQE